jgi:hypothetical protein
MRYLDTGDRDPSQTLFRWIEDVTSERISELRVQSGYFSIDAIQPLMPVLEQSRLHDSLARILIGSNGSCTLGDDVIRLVELLGIPRGQAQLGIISFGGGLYHPKTYYMLREDGSQVGFVGSANLTPGGLSTHVEAGIALDTREGDDPALLIQIATAIDDWFSADRNGLIPISGSDDVDDLIENNVLATRPTQRNRRPRGGTNGVTGSRPQLSPIVRIPGIRPGEPSIPLEELEDMGTQQTRNREDVVTSGMQSIPINGFPQYLLFDPEATAPTSGGGALTGTMLPGGSEGLIIQLNRDSARHFRGGTGTANISIPVATVSTLRFGIYGRYNRPRAEFEMRLRYLNDNAVISGNDSNTNVMGYGFTEGESGHGDIRLLVPATVRSFAERIIAEGHELPELGDYALLEWPTPVDSSFKISFLERESAIYQRSAQLYDRANSLGRLVGNGACWLPPGFSPAWQNDE